MSEDQFREILGRKVEDVERPKPLPTGTAQVAVESWEQVKSGKKGTPGVQFNFTLISYQEDVDEEQLKEYGDIVGVKFRDTIWITENSLWRLRETLEAMGLETEDREFKEVLAECIGAEVYVVIEHQVSQDGEAKFARVKNYLPV